MNPTAHASYDRDLFEATLNDWGWHGDPGDSLIGTRVALGADRPIGQPERAYVLARICGHREPVLCALRPSLLG